MASRTHHTSHHHVTAHYGDHEQSFDLVSGTTFAQLAERLAELAQLNHGWPIGVSVVLETSPEAASKARPYAMQGQAAVGQFL